MKVIIAGSRSDYYTVEEVQKAVEASGFTITSVVSGAAKGVDKSGEAWAIHNSIPVTLFPADWERYQGRAGPIRNSKMAVLAEALIAFPGGDGTADITRKMEALGKPVFKVTKNEEV